MAGELEATRITDKYGGCAVCGEVGWAEDRILGYVGPAQSTDTSGLYTKLTVSLLLGSQHGQNS